MHTIINTYILLLILSATEVQNKNIDQDVDLQYYLELNRKETRLMEFMDDKEALSLKLSQLQVINASRKKFRADPVKLDILASRVANKMCREAAENEYISHWNLAGEKPYHRYAFAGGRDHVSENAYGEWTSGKFSSSGSVISAMMKKGHDSFMKERAPNDGHKRNIIDKIHNYVGIGFHLTSNQFRYYEEFINRYLEFIDVPESMNPGEERTLDIETGGNGYLFFLTVYREKFPEPMKPAQLKKTGSYNDFSNEVYMNMPAWELSPMRNGSRYVIPLKFMKEGLYYIHIYTDRKEYTGSGSISTKGRSPVSGIVITVRK